MRIEQNNLFGIKRIDFNEQIKITCESINIYGQFHDHWAVAWSMGKDSTTLLTLLISLIESGQIMKPKSLTVLRADTRLELPPLLKSAPVFPLFGSMITNKLSSKQRNERNKTPTGFAKAFYEANK